MKGIPYRRMLAPVLVLMLGAVAPAWAEDPASAVEAGEPPALEAPEGELILGPADLAYTAPELETRRMAEASAGYRFVGTDGFGGRAAEYEYLHSSPAGGGQFVHLGQDLKLDADAAFLNRKDYLASLVGDFEGIYRFDLRTESFFHNLDHETLALDIFDDADRAQRFGISTRQDRVHLRYKLRDYPVHLNLTHWLIDREGTAQLRFADFTFDPQLSSGNSLKSRSRRIDRHSQEGTVGLDAHFGPVNLAYSFQIRQHDERVGTPTDTFVTRPGPPEHNENPESRFYSHTVKLYSSLSGGMTGAASYSYGRRDNRSALATVSGADRTGDTLQNAAGDFTYSPCAWFTTSVRYKHQEIDRDAPATLLVPLLTPGAVNVRPAIDTKRDVISTNLTIRPSTVLSLNGEYRGSFLRRDSTGPGLWELPAASDTHRGTLTVLLRPFKGLRLRGLYGYSTTDNPPYDTSPEEKHEGQLLATYAVGGGWGLTASYRIAREWNDNVSRKTNPFDGSPAVTHSLPLDRKAAHGAAGFWVSPAERLTISGHVGYLRNRVDQAVLFASALNSSQAATEYVSQGELFSLGAVYHVTEAFDLSLALQELRSRAEFQPAEVTGGGIPTAGVTELSRVRTIERSLSARADYHLSKRFSCGLDYSYRDYDNRDGTFGEGGVHVLAALLSTRW